MYRCVRVVNYVCFKLTERKKSKYQMLVTFCFCVETQFIIVKKFDSKDQQKNYFCPDCVSLYRYIETQKFRLNIILE